MTREQSVEAKRHYAGADLPDREFIVANTMPVPFSGCWIWLGAVSKYGYGTFQRPDSRIPRTAHRFSYEAFTGDRVKLPWQVNHRCDVKLCCNPDHLYKGTQSDNFRDMLQRHPYASEHQRKAGRAAAGALRERAKQRCHLTDAQVAEVLSSAGKHTEVGRKYGVSGDVIWGIRSGRYYRHIPRDTPTRQAYRCARLLTDEQALEALSSKASDAELGAKYGVNRNVIWTLRHRKTYRHLHPSGEC
jgi:hypothetical protein